MSTEGREMKDNVLKKISQHPGYEISKFALGSGTCLLRKITSLAPASVSPPHLGSPLQRGCVLCPHAVPATLQSCSDLWPLNSQTSTKKEECGNAASENKCFHTGTEGTTQCTAPVTQVDRMPCPLARKWHRGLETQLKTSAMKGCSLEHF